MPHVCNVTVLLDARSSGATEQGWCQRAGRLPPQVQLCSMTSVIHGLELVGRC